MSSPSLTLADVGRRAGVSAATACMALRSDPRISMATQRKVRQAAKELNYLPDPLLSALVARRDRGRSRKVFANLAALVDDRWFDLGRQGWLDFLLAAMKSTSYRLGYDLDVLRLRRDLQPSPDRILHARGIRGLAILPLRENAPEMALDWNRYALITFENFSSLGRRMHRVSSDAFAGMQFACEKIANLGYRRVGLANSLEAEQALRYEWLGALVKERFLKGSRLRVTAPYLPKVFEKKGFFDWIAREKPECVVTNDRQLWPWLAEAGWRIPQDIGVVFLEVNAGDEPGMSGVAQHHDVSGENAIEQLHASLLRGETGFPEHPKEILTLPHWVEGTTVRRMESASSK